MQKACCNLLNCVQLHSCLTILFFFQFSAKCIDHYTKLSVHNYDHKDDCKDVDSRLETVVNRMFQRCLHDGHYKQAVGIALETRRIDILEKAIMESVRYLWLHICLLFIWNSTSLYKRLCLHLNVMSQHIRRGTLQKLHTFHFITMIMVSVGHVLLFIFW